MENDTTMNTPTQPSANPTPSPKRRHGLRNALLVVLIILLLLCASVAWILMSASGARTAFSLAERFVPGLQVNDVQGPLTGPLRIGSLKLDNPERKIELRDLTLDWEPRTLWQRHLHIRSLQVGQLNLTSSTKQSDEPAQLPDSLALPLTLQIDRVQVAGGTVNWGALNLIELGAFGFALDYDAKRYRLGIDEFSVHTETESNPVDARLQGELTLADRQPYALKGELTAAASATVQQKPVQVNGRLTADGSLVDLRTSIDLALRQEQAQAQVTGNALLHPFGEQLLGPTHLTVAGLDLAAVAKGLPLTSLDVVLDVAEDGSGKLVLNNAAAGLYDQQRLPLSTVSIPFRQEAGRIEFPAIQLQTGSPKQPAGTIHGKGSFAGGALDLDLTTEALNLSRLDSRIQATKLKGEVLFRHVAERQEVTLDLADSSQHTPLSLKAHASLADSRVELSKVLLTLGKGKLDANGHLELEGDQEFAAQGKLTHLRLRDLGEFDNLPKVDLNGDFKLSGQRAPKLQADLAFRIQDSLIDGHPLHGKGEARLRGDSLRIPQLQLVAGSNRLNVQGALSEADSRLDFDLNAPQLQQFGPGFDGSLQLKGRATGSFTAPRIVANWHGKEIRLMHHWQMATLQGNADVHLDTKQPFSLKSAIAELNLTDFKGGDQSLATLDAKLRFAPQPSAPLLLDVRGTDFRAGQLGADTFSLQADGSTARHAITFKMNEPKQTWQIHASGGLRDLARTPAWQGTLDRLDAKGTFDAKLAAPAPLLVSAARTQLDNLRIDAESGLIVVEQFLLQPQRVVTKGFIERLQLAPLLKLATDSPVLATDLELDGNWDFTVAGSVQGKASLRRRKGDIVMRGGAPVPLGLQNLEAQVTASGRQLELDFKADGKQLGHIDLTGQTRLSRAGAGWTIAPDAPVSGRARLDIPNLGWIGPLASATLITEGRLQANLDVAGTFGAPLLRGGINGSGLRVNMTDTGVDLRNGVLKGTFTDERLLLETLRFTHEGGSIGLDGVISLVSGQPTATLKLAARRYPILNRTDRRLVISGDSALHLQNNVATVKGDFLVNEGAIDIGRSDMPQLSDDVVIVGKEDKSEGSGQLTAALDINIKLGDGIKLTGHGLDAMLLGELRIQNPAGTPPQAYGTLHIAKGTFSAYGRELDIERGELRFTGPLTNPALTILAMRRGLEVEAGVSVVGNVLAPRITLVSEPSVPDAEKLAWLVLGRSLQSAGGGDMDALQDAAAQLLSKGAIAGVQSQIGTALGLDDFGISSEGGGLEGSIVTLGKRLSSRLYVSYQQSLASAGNAVLLRYTLTPRISLEAETGSRSVFSVFYNIAFD